MTETALFAARRLMASAVAAVRAVAESGVDDELVALLGLCESTRREMDQLTVAAVAGLERRGTFAQRGYRSATAALADLLGCERFEARRRVVAAEQVAPRVGLDGGVLPARLPATAGVFAAGRAGLRHVEVIARVLGSAAAERLSPEQWAGVEEQLAGKADCYTPAELHTWGTTLVELLDQDGAGPDDRPPVQLNEVFLTRRPGGGGKIKGRFDDAALFAAVATAVDAKAAPLTADDHRPTGQRQAEALADICGYVLDHGELPDVGGHRPHLTVTVRLDDLENRARAGCLDLAGVTTPQALRMLACDAGVVPVVLGGAGQPLDVGRATRTIPDGLRRAVATRDRGCAHPGCDRPPSWCEVHHVHEWAHGGETRIDNLVMLCRAHHRQTHSTDWTVRIRDGLPEFIPPRWIDPLQTPRRKAPPDPDQARRPQRSALSPSVRR